MDWKSQIQGLIGAGATVDSIAAGMGVTPNAVREVLAGRTKAPRADAAFRLARMVKNLNAEQGSASEAIRIEIDSRMSKRALRARLGMSTDKQLAKVLQLPTEQVESWTEEGALPALPEIQRLLGVQEQHQAQPAPHDPDENRYAPLEVA
ncbi:TPA: hypothetical protein ACGRP0_004449 [Stenotrophomonas maltophilia]